MNDLSPLLPYILVMAGHDPCGGAGITADIEILAAHRCRAATLITTLTVQNSRALERLIPVSATEFREQAWSLLDDLTFRAVKIGLPGDLAMIEAISDVLRQLPGVPVIFDPVLAAGSGIDVANPETIAAIRALLLPHTHILTPNTAEAQSLAAADTRAKCGRALNARGCEYVYITGADEIDNEVLNTLHHAGTEIAIHHITRLPHVYHGSGCTLTTAIAARIAQGFDPVTAIVAAQEYTWQSLKHGFQPGGGQYQPDRLQPIPGSPSIQS